MVKKKFPILIFSILFIALALSTLGAITFQNIFPTTSPYVTSDDTVNLSYGIDASDGLSSITHSWNGTNTTLYDSSLVLFYNFDNRSALGENDTFVRDLSMYGNNGTVVGGSNISWTPNGKYNGAFNFSGNQNTYITNNTPIIDYFTNQSLTLSLWFKIYGNISLSGGYQYVYTLPIFDGFSFYFTNYTTYLSTVFTMKNSLTNVQEGFDFMNYNEYNNWVNYLITYDNKTVKIYKNSLLKYTYPFNGNLNKTNNSFYLGTLNIGWGLFNGSIDNIMIWNRSLSTNEIDYLYRTQITKYNESYLEYNVTNNNLLYSSVDHFLCSSNSTLDVFCSNSYNALFEYSKINITTNFSTSVGNVKDDMYGVNANRVFNNDFSIYRKDLATVISGDYEWQRSTFLNADMNNYRIGMNLYKYYMYINNLDFERWSNLNEINITLGMNTGAGYWLASRNGAYVNGTVSSSTDSLSGTYSINLTGAKYNFIYTDLYSSSRPFLTAGNNYTYTIWVKGNGTGRLFIQPMDTWGYCPGESYTEFTATNDWQLVSVNCNPITNVSQGYRIPHSIESTYGELLFDNASFYVNGKQQNYINYASLENERELMEWAYNNNINVYAFTDNSLMSLIGNDYCYNKVPSYCTGNIDYTSAYLPSVIDWINQTTNNGAYLSRLKVSVANEPNYYSSWFANVAIDSVEGAVEYVRRYNLTSIAIKDVYPTLDIGGPAVSTSNSHYNLFTTFLSNQSWLMYPADFHTIHTYGFYLDNSLEQKTILDRYLANCTTYSVDCSDLVMGEWNVGDKNLQSNSSISRRYEMSVLQSFISLLNYYPSNVTSQMYVFQMVNNSGIGIPYSAGSSYPGSSTQKFGMVQDTNFNSTDAGQLASSYNATLKIAHLCPAGATVYVTSGDDSAIKQVSCKKGNMYSLIVINTGTEAKNITLNMSMTNGTVVFPYSNLVNYEDDTTTYKVNDGVAQLGVMDSYEILYLYSGVEGGATLRGVFKLNEGSGNTIYDSLQNLSNGVKSGATWVTDGILNTLASGVDYTISTSGLFVVSSSYLFNYMNSSWSYLATWRDTGSTASLVMVDSLGNSTTFLSILIVISFAVVILTLFKPSVNTNPLGKPHY